MGSFSFGEILTILLIILIVFGPKRLPELARRVGQLLGRARQAVQDFTETVQKEYGDDASTITGVVSDFDGIRKDLGKAMGAMTGISTSSSPTPPSDDEMIDDDAITDVTAFHDEDWPPQPGDEDAEE